MLKPPHPVAVAGYLAAMLVNPNNHALDGGPGTSGLEVEVVDQLRGHVRAALPRPGPPDLERDDRQPRGAVGRARGAPGQAHRALRRRALHPRAHVRAARRDRHGGRRRRRRAHRPRRACEAECARGDVGTVVLTTGSTGLGAIDRVDEALALRERYGVRLHADAAYGGFFTLLAAATIRSSPPRPYAAIAQCDSVVVDPHKHGLQPYGCGAVLFADPAVARVYSHDSPFTYFTEADLHLGEISLECSRAGAAAAGAVADAAGAAAGARRGPRRGARGRAARGARLGGAAALLRGARPARRARARHRHLPAARSARCRRSTPPAAPS